MCGAESQASEGDDTQGDDTEMMKKGNTEVWHADKWEETQPKLEIWLGRQAERSEP